MFYMVVSSAKTFPIGDAGVKVTTVKNSTTCFTKSSANVFSQRGIWLNKRWFIFGEFLDIDVSGKGFEFNLV